MSISGDPTVHLTILQPYLGGPFSDLVGTGFGELSDGNNDGIATLADAFIRTTVSGPGIVGSLGSQIDLNCVATGPAGFEHGPCPGVPPNFQLVGQALNTTDFPLSLLRMDIQFTLSDFDAVSMSGSSVLRVAPTAVPEPASGALFTVGLLAFAGVSLRRKRA